MPERTRRRRVTVIDDSPELLALLNDVLRLEGVEVSLLDGVTTLQDIAASTPDLLVMDLRLASDGASGLELIRQARSDRALAGVPIIVMSAAIDDIRKHETELREMPSLSVLPKPFTLDDLESSVDLALGDRIGAATGG